MWRHMTAVSGSCSNAHAAHTTVCTVRAPGVTTQSPWGEVSITGSIMVRGNVLDLDLPSSNGNLDEAQGQIDCSVPVTVNINEFSIS